MCGRRITLTICAMLGSFVLTAAAASAEGVTRVQQSDGTVQVYEHVSIRLDGQNLWLRSADGMGVLEVADGACSFVREIQRCLPFETTLHQHGESHAIALEHGTVYLNLTDDPHRLPHSDDRLAPHNVLVLLHTARGTYISVKGTLDAVK
jgi:hypothetical protein